MARYKRYESASDLPFAIAMIGGRTRKGRIRRLRAIECFEIALWIFFLAAMILSVVAQTQGVEVGDRIFYGVMTLISAVLMFAIARIIITIRASIRKMKFAETNGGVSS